uniref:Thiosulfate sulfurtransferase, mitochondrial n=2 Tax=Planktothrix pseudagardhii TaxID=132604 RepID=A0A9W4G6M6_9CYAN|nr:Putative thiosulfate sulfurtransferase, mitochondrial [Planktothrix pseudagardhii]
MNPDFNIKTNKRWLYPFVLTLIILGAGMISLTLIAKMNHLDVVTFVKSFNTPEVTVEELSKKDLKSVIFIDVRSPEEYEEDHIPNSILVPITEIEQGKGIEKIQEIAKTYSVSHVDKPTLILYCQLGPRSIKAYQKLEKTGLNLMVLQGGMTAWRKQFKL